LAFGGGRFRHRAARVALCGVATAFGVALVEAPTVLLGIDYQERFGTSFGDPWLQLSARGNRLDPELLHVHAPYSVFRGRVRGNLADLGIPEPREYEVDVRYDGNGFRNDRDYARADVAAIGDSFVEAALVPLEETVVKRLERSLGRPTVNLGQAAYGLRQELAVLRRYALPLRPKEILWFFFDGNDLRDVDGYEWARAHLAELTVARPLSTRLFTRNALLAAVMLAERRQREPFGEARRHAGLFRRPDGTVERMYLDRRLPSPTEKQWRVLTETLMEARELSERAGARMTVVYITRKSRIYRDLVEIEPGSMLAEWEMNDLPDALSKWCASAGIGYIDTIAPLRAAAERGEEIYLPDDVHWSSRGHEIAAEAILRGSGLQSFDDSSVESARGEGAPH
ncbi:MAG: alginate O-acetyltransferase AlgX-related protein, partial [Candidatus Binatia bacterium]